jgi:hypothetical protein
MSAEKKRELVVDAITLLNTYKIKVSNANVRKLGIGASIVNQYYSEVKGELGPQEGVI